MVVEKINEGFGFSNARNGEHYDVNQAFLDIITKEFADELGIGFLRNNYAAMFDVERACHLRSRSYDETPDVLAQDKKRDNAFLLVSQTINAGQYSSNESKRNAALRLIRVLKPYKNAPRLSLMNNSSAISKFLQEMEEEQNAADLETLGLTTDLTELKEANEAFIQIYRARSNVEYSQYRSENMKSIRPKVDAAFRTLAKTINALYRVNFFIERDAEKEARMKEIIEDVNAKIYKLQKTLVQAGIISSPAKDDDSSASNTGEEEVQPQITRVFQVEGGDAENPNHIKRGALTQIDWLGGFTLVDKTGENPGDIILQNDQGYDEKISAEAISQRDENGCQFTMVNDLTEGNYTLRIETYDGGNPLVVQYLEPIYLD